MLKNKLLTGMVLAVLVMTPTMVMARGMHGPEGMHGEKSMQAGKDLPMGKWWESPKMAEKLKLTDAEKAKLKEAFDKSHRKLIKLKSNVETERFELGSLLDKKTLDEAAVMQQFTKLEKARTELARERFNFLVEVRKILGQERYQVLKEEGRKRRSSRMHRRMEGRSSGPPHDEM